MELPEIPVPRRYLSINSGVLRSSPSLPDNVLLAARGQFKPGAFLQKLLADPDLSLLNDQLERYNI